MVGFDPDLAMDMDVPVLSPCELASRSRGSSLSATTPAIEDNIGPLAAAGAALATHRQNSTDSLSSELAYSPFPDLPPRLTIPPLPNPPRPAVRQRASLPSPKLSSPLPSAPLTIELPDGTHEKLQSTPTAELGPFEYPDPEPDTPAARRAASGPVPALPSSHTYITPPNIPLAVGGALLGTLEGRPRRSEPHPQHRNSHGPHPNPGPQGVLRRRGSIASGHIPRLAAMLDQYNNSYNPHLAHRSHDTINHTNRGAPRRPTSLLAHTADFASASPSAPVSALAPSSPVTATASRQDRSADLRGYSRTVSGTNALQSKTRATPGPAAKSPPTQPQRLVPTQPRRGGQVAFAHAPLPTVIPPSLLARRGSLPMIFSPAPTLSPTGTASLLPGVSRVKGDGDAENQALKRPPARQSCTQ